MKIKTLQQAEHHAINYLQHSTVVVGENGDISADCDVDETCKVHEGKSENFFIVRGERKVKEVKKAKAKDNDSEIK